MATVAAAATAGAVVVVPLRTNALELGLSSTEQQHHGRVMSLCAHARYLTGRLLASDYYQKRGGASFLGAKGTARGGGVGGGGGGGGMLGSSDGLGLGEEGEGGGESLGGSSFAASSSSPSSMALAAQPMTRGQLRESFVKTTMAPEFNRLEQLLRLCCPSDATASKGDSSSGSSSSSSIAPTAAEASSGAPAALPVIGATAAAGGRITAADVAMASMLSLYNSEFPPGHLQQFPMIRMYEGRVGGMVSADFDHQLLAKRAL